MGKRTSVLLATAAFAFWAGPALADTVLTQEDLGIRAVVPSGAGDWCGPTVSIRLEADNPAVFGAEGFDGFFSSMRAVVAVGCPQATVISLEGYVADQLVWTAVSSAELNWRVHETTDALAGDAPGGLAALEALVAGNPDAQALVEQLITLLQGQTVAPPPEVPVTPAGPGKEPRAPATGGVTPLAADTTITATLDGTEPRLDYDNHYDCYVVSARAGEQFTVTMRSGDFDSYLEVVPAGSNCDDVNFDLADDNTAGENDARVTIVFDTAGERILRATSFGENETGTYTLETELTRDPTGVPIANGDTVTGFLERGDGRLGDTSRYDCYVVHGEAGQTLEITMRSTDFDAWIDAGPGGAADCATAESLRSDDQSGGGDDAQLLLTFDRTGDWVLRPSSWFDVQDGAYTLQVREFDNASRLAAQQPIGLALGEEITGALDADDPVFTSGDRTGARFDCYTVIGSAGDEFVVTMRSEAVDTYLIAGPSDPAGCASTSLPYYDDDGFGGGLDSQLIIDFDQYGEYTVLATAYSGTGPYTIRLDTPETAPEPEPYIDPTYSAPELYLDSPFDGRLDVDDAVLAGGNRTGARFDCFVVYGYAGETIDISLYSDAFDTYLQAGKGSEGYTCDSPGDLPLTDDDSGDGLNALLALPFTEDDVYVIRATSYSTNAAGAYTITATIEGNYTDLGAPELYLDEPVAGALEDADPTLVGGNREGAHFDCYVLYGYTGETLRVDMTADYDTYLQAGLASQGYTCDSTGDLPVTDDDSGDGFNARLSLTYASDDTYVIRATSYSAGTTGDYTITATLPASAVARPIAVGQTMTGELTSDSATRSSGQYFVCYVLRPQQSGRVTIDLTSDAFDAYLEAGLAGEYECNAQLSNSDDDGGDTGLNARLTLDVTAGQSYILRASSYGTGSTGTFTLALAGPGDKTTAAAGPVASLPADDPFETALDAFNAGDYATAYTLWLPLAQAGNIDAQFNVGVLFENGQGREADLVMAADWYRRAANQGDPEAQAILGDYYADGTLGPDDAEAYYWYTLAAEGYGPGEEQDDLLSRRDTVAARLSAARIDAAERRVLDWEPVYEN